MVGTVQVPFQPTPMPPEISGEILRKDGSSILGKGTYTKVGDPTLVVLMNDGALPQNEEHPLSSRATFPRVEASHQIPLVGWSLGDGQVLLHRDSWGYVYEGGV